MTNHQDKLNSYLRSLSLDSSSKAKKHGNHLSSVGFDKETPEVVTDSSKLKPRKAPPKLKLNSLKRFNKKTHTVHDLPTEVLVSIFKLLTPHDLMTCSCVCQRWMELAGDNLLWQPLYKRFKLPQPGRPDSVYTIHAGIKWKTAFMERCIQRRNVRLKNLLKKKDPYTTLPANIDMMLRNFGVEWNLVFIDRNDTEHVYAHSDVFKFNTSVTIRWYSLEFLSLENIHSIRFTAKAPILFEKDGLPVPGCPQKSSLLLSIPWTGKQDKFTAVEDETLKLHIIHPGVVIATWKDGGDIAFVSLCLHKFTLMERILFGHQTRIYQHTHNKPAADDVDNHYGLHDFQCNVELRQQRALCWTERFTGLHCSKEVIKDGVVRLNLIKTEKEQEHSHLNKKLCLPWKTDVFKGVFPNICILDMTLFDEFMEPFWCVSHPVQVRKEDSSQVSMLYHGDQFNIEYSDEIGRIDCQVVRDEDEGRDLITNLSLSIRMEAINSWFSTSYS
ncbi:F-box only protein 15-like [Apostichopus japonicus]|uniref:F-box only protein 15-like n=1 Tax=Stichopus japonicus TaxID=307972 RepID=UPI003AB56AB5